VIASAFRTIEQTEPLVTNKVTVPVVAMGGELSRGGHVREMTESVAQKVTGVVIPGCGHLCPRSAPSGLRTSCFSARTNQEGLLHDATKA
jgi:pimeloyl-ACP methyl ester carboxylesterase